MESGTPGLKATHDGWLNRALPQGRRAKSRRCAPCRWGRRCRAPCAGANPAIALQSIGDFQVRDRAGRQAVRDHVHGQQGPGAARRRPRDLRGRDDAASRSRSSPTRPPAGAEYPRGRFGDSLRQIAQLIKADVGVEVAFADIGGWDTTSTKWASAPRKASWPICLREFGQALGAFWQDLGDRMADVVVVTMSEFGRTAHENGNRGTDHGHANCMFVMGGAVKGGKVYGEWPGLEQEQLYEGRDLALTTDFRDVLGELVSRHLGNPTIGSVFPGYEPQAAWTRVAAIPPAVPLPDSPSTPCAPVHNWPGPPHPASPRIPRRR